MLGPARRRGFLSVLLDSLCGILIINLQNLPDRLDDFGGVSLPLQNLVHIATVCKKPRSACNLFFKPLLGLSTPQKLRLYAQAKRRELT